MFLHHWFNLLCIWITNFFNRNNVRYYAGLAVDFKVNDQEFTSAHFYFCWPPTKRFVLFGSSENLKPIENEERQNQWGDIRSNILREKNKRLLKFTSQGSPDISGFVSLLFAGSRTRFSEKGILHGGKILNLNKCSFKYWRITKNTTHSCSYLMSIKFASTLKMNAYDQKCFFSCLFCYVREFSWRLYFIKGSTCMSYFDAQIGHFQILTYV